MDFFFKKTLIISDNTFLCESFFEVCRSLEIPEKMFDVAHSPSNKSFRPLISDSILVQSLDVKKEANIIIEKYDLVLSLHCKQLFPLELISAVKCINVHPGYNPYNRGWYPQVFSIINKNPIGATIHEIDDQLDHGDIIAQKQLEVKMSDTSGSLYKNILQLEIELLRNYLIPILKNNYKTKSAKTEGNVNYKSDFKALLEIDLSKNQTIGETIDLFRALTHEEYKNAYFIDNKTGMKVYVNLILSYEKGGSSIRAKK